MAKARRSRNAGERFRITATVERFGEKNGSGPPVKMVLLKDVHDASSGVLLTDHLWLAAGGWTEHLGQAIRLRSQCRCPPASPRQEVPKTPKPIVTSADLAYARLYARMHASPASSSESLAGLGVLTVAVDCHRVNGGLLRSTTQATNRRVQSARAW